MTTDTPIPQTTSTKKKHHWVRWTLVVLAVFIVVAGIIGGSHNSNVPHTGTSITPVPGISQGFGAHDASADVKFAPGRIDGPDEIGDYTANLIITNHSSQRSDYFVDLTLESVDGKIQFDTSVAAASSVEPGQVAHVSAVFMPSGTVSGNVQARITDVQRTAS